jgi:hypothetical protein
MALQPGRVNFICPQGATFRKNITFKIEDDFVDLTGYSSRLQVRENYYSEDFLVSITDQDLMTLGGSAGTIDILLPASDTSNIPAGDFVYDLELESGGGEVTRLIQGSFIVTPEVTR